MYNIIHGHTNPHYNYDYDEYVKVTLSKLIRKIYSLILEINDNIHDKKLIVRLVYLKSWRLHNEI